mmetsp:Transcript_18392/g.44329  ORF Transcript_18392/g.44329 Transcript_18392/m.44329 type:complete len:546 (-) Transcript_18392:67-1704(-)
MPQASEDESAGNYAFALWNLIIRPPRRKYTVSDLGPKEFRLGSVKVRRTDIDLPNGRGLTLKCSHFEPKTRTTAGPAPCVVYLHGNASCRVEALQYVTLLLPLEITLFCFDFAGCGISDGEYVSLGWHERDDLATVMQYLREKEVGAIGLWGRSMGAVTALLHADRDHTIGGMVLDSPFANLHLLVEELARSPHMVMKVPSIVLKPALSFVNMMIKQKANFSIDSLSPIDHVAKAFVPAFFVAGEGDDFILPHHTRQLFEKYGGDKELEMVDGDHNSARPTECNKKCVHFFVRAFHMEHIFARWTQQAFTLGQDAMHLQASDWRAELVYETIDGVPALHGMELESRRWRCRAPCRLEGALQLQEHSTESCCGVCFILQAPSEDVVTVYFALVSVTGLRLMRVKSGEGPVVLAEIEMPVPVLEPVMTAFEYNVEAVYFQIGEAQLRWDVDSLTSRSINLWTVRFRDMMFFDFQMVRCVVLDQSSPALARAADAEAVAAEAEAAAERQPDEERLEMLQAQPAPAPMAEANAPAPGSAREKKDACSVQ